MFQPEILPEIEIFQYGNISSDCRLGLGDRQNPFVLYDAMNLPVAQSSQSTFLEDIYESVTHLPKTGLYPFSVRHALFQLYFKTENVPLLIGKNEILRDAIFSVIFSSPEIDAKLNFRLFLYKGLNLIDKGMPSHLHQNRLRLLFSYCSRFSTDTLLLETTTFKKYVFDKILPPDFRSDVLKSVIRQLLLSNTEDK